MKTIKFRGKVEGHWWYTAPDDENWQQFWVLVDRETVGQYTEFNDCKGTEIYEGDIVMQGYFALNDTNRFGPEPWKHLPEGIGETDITTPIGAWAVGSDSYDLYKLNKTIQRNPDVLGVKVIGNTYDTPNILTFAKE